MGCVCAAGGARQGQVRGKSGARSTKVPSVLVRTHALPPPRILSSSSCLRLLTGNGEVTPAYTSTACKQS